MLRKLRTLGLGILSTLMISLPLEAAEKIQFVYGGIRLDLSVKSLETFAENNIIDSNLASYLNAAGANNEEGRQKLREILTKKVNIDAIAISRFLNTPTGESFLERFGVILSIPGGRNGKYALRGAMVQAALSEEGLTLINFFRCFPTDLQVNIQDALIAGEYLQILQRATNELVVEMKKMTATNLEKENYPVEILPDIRKEGNNGIAPRETLQTKDSQSQKIYTGYLYQPQRFRSGKTPVVVLSHGLGSKPEDFEHIAKQLASYGYVVISPVHSGSDFQYFQDMLAGYHRDMYDLNEFIDRPKSVTLFLNQLEQLNSTRFNNRLDLENVGMIGHSFGGYTALALAGATINFPYLETICSRRIWGPNVSLFLQCRALNLPRKDYNFRDERIKALLVVNPVASIIFGEEGLNKVTLPTIFGAGTRDPATPAAIEQLRPFVWLNSKDKYFVLTEGQAHVNVSKLDPNVQASLKSIPDLKLPNQSAIDTYANVLVLAFFENHLVNNDEFAPYLTSSYTEYLSKPEHPLYIVDEEAVIPFSNLFNRLKPQETDPIYPPN